MNEIVDIDKFIPGYDKADIAIFIMYGRKRVGVDYEYYIDWLCKDRKHIIHDKSIQWSMTTLSKDQLEDVYSKGKDMLDLAKNHFFRRDYCSLANILAGRNKEYDEWFNSKLVKHKPKKKAA